MSTLHCKCGSVVPVEESIGMQCRDCHNRPLNEAITALLTFTEKTYERVHLESPHPFSVPVTELRATFSQASVLRARAVVHRFGVALVERYSMIDLLRDGA